MFWKNLSYFHFTIQGSTGLTAPKITYPHFFSLSPFFLSPFLSKSSSFYISSFLSSYRIHTHSIQLQRVTLTPSYLWPWKSALRWPLYVDPVYYFSALYSRNFVIIFSWIRSDYSFEQTTFSFTKVLCQLWLKLAQLFWRRFSNFDNFISLVRYNLSLKQTVLNPRILCAKSGWK